MLSELVLQWSPAGPQAHTSQLDRIATVAAQENVPVSVIRVGQELVLPLHGFTIYADRGEGDPFVAVELVHTYMTLNHPSDVALYRRLHERMAAAAVTADAVVLIRQAAS
ncbi:MAG: Scr1 family TA system antitoxin-like transcriptional regulator [Pseudonocardiaceae bacterium]